MLMQNSGVTNQEHYVMLWYFWSSQFADALYRRFRDGVCDAAGYSLNYPSQRWKLFVITEEKGLKTISRYIKSSLNGS